MNIFEKSLPNNDSLINAESPEEKHKELEEKKAFRDELVAYCDSLESSTLTVEDRDKINKMRESIAGLNEEIGQLSKDLDIPLVAKYEKGIEYTHVPVPTEEEVVIAEAAKAEKKDVNTDPNAIDYDPTPVPKDIIKGPYKPRTPSDGSIL